MFKKRCKSQLTTFLRACHPSGKCQFQPPQEQSERSFSRVNSCEMASTEYLKHTAGSLPKPDFLSYKL